MAWTRGCCTGQVGGRQHLKEAHLRAGGALRQKALGESAQQACLLASERASSSTQHSDGSSMYPARNANLKGRAPDCQCPCRASAMRSHAPGRTPRSCARQQHFVCDSCDLFERVRCAHRPAIETPCVDPRLVQLMYAAGTRAFSTRAAWNGTSHPSVRPGTNVKFPRRRLRMGRPEMSGHSRPTQWPCAGLVILVTHCLAEQARHETWLTRQAEPVLCMSSAH